MTVHRYFGGVIEKIAQPEASILYGDLIFTTFRAFGSLIPWWEHHLERLRLGAIFLASHSGQTDCAAWDLMRQSLEDARSKFLHHFQDQQWIGRPTLKRQGEGLQLMFFAWEAPALQSTGQKLAVALSERKRDLPAEIKGGGYVSENEGRQWAINQGMDDILFWHGSQMSSAIHGLRPSGSYADLIGHHGQLMILSSSALMLDGDTSRKDADQLRLLGD